MGQDTFRDFAALFALFLPFLVGPHVEYLNINILTHLRKRLRFTDKGRSNG